MEGISTVWVGAGVWCSFCKAGGGYGDNRQLFMGLEFRRRDPPVISCANDLDL